VGITLKGVILVLLSVLCPIGLLIALVVAAVMAMAAESRGKPRYINCPDCLDSVLVDAATCPHCGRKMK
jgi:hypothetical protein